MKFVINLPELKLDWLSFTKTLDRTMSQIIRESAREWLRTILVIGVPVETGMAKAALVPLGRFLKSVAGLGITPRRKPYYSKIEEGVQSIALGEARGQSFTIQDDKSHPLSFVYMFEWTPEVVHWYWKEFYNGSSMSGEEALDQADFAFLTYYEAAVARRLPDLVEYIT